MDLGQIFTNNHVAKYMASLFNLDNDEEKKEINETD